MNENTYNPMRLKITVRDPDGKGRRLVSSDLKVTLNDEEITEYYSLRLELDSGSCLKATISFYPEDVDVDVDILADLFPSIGVVREPS